MSNKKTNKQRHAAQLTLMWNFDSCSPRQIMLAGWLDSTDTIESDGNIIIDRVTLDRIVAAIQQRLSVIMQVPEYVGIQPMVDRCATVYTLQHNSPPLDTIRDIELVLRSSTVESTNRQLDISISVPDLLNCEHEIVQATAMEISRSLNEEFMDIVYQNSSPTDFRIDFGDEPSVIMMKLMNACHTVATTSHRGEANVIILPAELYAHILPHMTGQWWFTPSPTQTISDLLFVGTIFGQKEVYVSIRNTLVLVGYKGGLSEADTGIIFCPHKLSARLVSDPHTNVLSMTMNTTHGHHVTKNAKDFYINIQVR